MTIENLISTEVSNNIAIDTSNFTKEDQINKLILYFRKAKLNYSFIESHSGNMKLNDLGL